MSPNTLQIFDSDRTDVDEISLVRKRTGTELAHYPLSGRTSCSSFSSNKFFCITSLQRAHYVSGLKLSFQTSVIERLSSRVKASFGSSTPATVPRHQQPRRFVCAGESPEVAHADRHTRTHTYRQTDRQTDIQTDRQTDRHVHTHAHTRTRARAHTHKRTHAHTHARAHTHKHTQECILVLCVTVCSCMSRCVRAATKTQTRDRGRQSWRSAGVGLGCGAGSGGRAAKETERTRYYWRRCRRR